MFELFKDCRVVLVVLRFSGQLGKFGDIVVDVGPFHFELIQLGCRLIVGVGVVPVLDEILFEFFPDINVRGGWYGPPHDPVFYASFPFGNGTSLYKRECVCDFSVRVGHDWCGGVEELVEFKFVHKLVGLRPIAIENGGFLPF